MIGVQDARLLQGAAGQVRHIKCKATMWLTARPVESEHSRKEINHFQKEH
ncbi:hypothetical protein P8610_14230 [Fictibacillus sp. UD]